MAGFNCIEFLASPADNAMLLHGTVNERSG
jgi:hypothetical protein